MVNPIPSRPSEARQSGHDTWAVTVPERWLTGLTALARLSWWIQSLPGQAKQSKAVTILECSLQISACQTSSLARLSWWIQSLPGRAKRGKAVTIPERCACQTMVTIFYKKTVPYNIVLSFSINDPLLEMCKQTFYRSNTWSCGTIFFERILDSCNCSYL